MRALRTFLPCATAKVKATRGNLLLNPGEAGGGKYLLK